MVKKGSYVRVKSNAPGTAWEFGHVEDIDEQGALIGYGDKTTSRNWRLRGLVTRVRLDDLEEID